MDSEIYLVGVDDVDCDVECDTHGELQQTMVAIPQNDARYVPADDQVVHYCENCLRQMLNEMSIKKVSRQDVIVFLLVNDWGHMREYFEPIPEGISPNELSWDRLGSPIEDENITVDETPLGVNDISEVTLG